MFVVVHICFIIVFFLNIRYFDIVIFFELYYVEGNEFAAHVCQVVVRSVAVMFSRGTLSCFELH